MSCTILYSTQTGRAKACARRTARILRENTSLKILGGTSFDEVEFTDLVASTPSENHFFLFFVSTTGDGVHCDSIQKTWKSLLKKSLPPNLFQGTTFALFSLGDRAYGPQFCAAGRKLAARLMQLGMTTKCEVGYGDDNTPNGGCFADLDHWIQTNLLASLEVVVEQSKTDDAISTSDYKVTILEDTPSKPEEQWKQESYQAFFAHQSPMTAYSYNGIERVDTDGPKYPLLAAVEVNDRLTAEEWDQNTRHLRLRMTGTSKQTNSQRNSQEALPYTAGDIATILPSNPPDEVERFIQVLPLSLQAVVDKQLHLNYQKEGSDEASLGAAFPHWPKQCTLRGWLTYCADIHAPPEREDLRVLGQFCSPNHEMFEAQKDKLFSLSETSSSALYVDYILREKRCWTDVLFDFDSLREDTGSKLTVEALLTLLPPIRPRDFSIASSPSREVLERRKETAPSNDFLLELCVAEVEVTTPLGRKKWHGLCSNYLSNLIVNQSQVRLWIRPGSFAGLPMTPTTSPSRPQQFFESPLLCIGAGTGVAPLRGLLLEREAVRELASAESTSTSATELGIDQSDNILVFGCRRRDSDYYYEKDWNKLNESGRLFILPAFSREQDRKVYVQQKVKANGDALMKHILENDGAIYIAGNPSMARYTKEELVEITTRLLGDDEKKANLLFKKLQARGRFSVEAWS